MLCFVDLVSEKGPWLGHRGAASLSLCAGLAELHGYTAALQFVQECIVKGICLWFLPERRRKKGF